MCFPITFGRPYNNMCLTKLFGVNNMCILCCINCHNITGSCLPLNSFGIDEICVG